MITMVTIQYPKIGKPAMDVVLDDDLYIEQWIVPKGTTVKTVQGRDFGFVHLPKDCKDKRGFVIPRRIFSY